MVCASTFPLSAHHSASFPSPKAALTAHHLLGMMMKAMGAPQSEVPEWGAALGYLT